MANTVNPKHPSVRARGNKAATRRTLHVLEPGEAPPTPRLPERVDEDGDPLPWHQMTLDFWRDIWKSPMAPEYDESDIHGLFVLAAIVDKFWHNPSYTGAAEIRQARLPFGLSPMDRRRLQWEIDKGDEAEERTAARKAKADAKRAAEDVDDEAEEFDPRTVLGA